MARLIDDGQPWYSWPTNSEPHLDGLWRALRMLSVSDLRTSTVPARLAGATTNPEEQMDDSNNNDGAFGGASTSPTKAAQGNTSGAPLSKADKSTPAPSSKPTTGDSTDAAQRGSSSDPSTSSSGSTSSTGTGESGGGAGSGSSSGSGQ